MRQIIKTTYACSTCGTEFETEADCEAHEKLCKQTYCIGEMSYGYYDDDGVSFSVRRDTSQSGVGLYDGPAEIICRTMGKTPQEVRKSCINALRTHCEFARRRYAKAVKALDEYRRENEDV